MVKKEYFTLQILIKTLRREDIVRTSGEGDLPDKFVDGNTTVGGFMGGWLPTNG